ncbi:hypothetical protein AB0B79_34890 [Streptomyces sp. NPDC039022]|uniref:hypothetical protein n=1 Tax=Streptomyces sp. NPDC039022 TaxID=3157091 RepID=UPI0033FD5F5C
MRKRAAVATTAPARRTRRPAAPDAAEDLRLLTGLSDGARRTGVRRRVIAAWPPVAHRLARHLRDRGENLADRRPARGHTGHTGLGEEDVPLGLDALETYRSLSLDAPWPERRRGTTSGPIPRRRRYGLSRDWS